MLYERSAFELAELLRNRKCSAVELLDSVKKRAVELQPSLNAYISFNDNAAKAAEEADRRLAQGGDVPVLCGIPVAVKDNISVKGLRTTCASKMLENYVPPYSAAAVELLEAAGAVIIGKTNMDEFAMGSASDTGIFGAVKNPVNTSYSAGGSSGGSAAAVAGGAATLALGSDTGGSVRQPASFCGVAGFCPSYGAVSRYGLIAFASSLDRIGTIGKNIRDVQLLHNIINVTDPRDVTNNHNFFSEHSFHSLKGVRIGIPEELFGDMVSDDVKTAVIGAVKLMESEGAVIHDISLPSLSSAVKAYYVISSAEASSNLARYDGVRYGFRAEGCSSPMEMIRKSRTEGFGDEVKRRILLGTFVLSEGCSDSYYKRASLLRQRLCREFDEIFRSCDAVVSPVYPEAGIKLGKGKRLADTYSADICTVPSSLAGLPAVSIPCGTASDGLPIGLQLIGRRYGDNELLSIAYCYEVAGGVYHG